MNYISKWREKAPRNTECDQRWTNMKNGCDVMALPNGNPLKMGLVDVWCMVERLESAEIALEILNKETIQVMFIDLHLPSMNGMELCKEIRKSNRSAAIFIITGFPSLLEEFKSNGAEFDGWFSKPLDLDLLIKAAEDGFRKAAD